MEKTIGAFHIVEMSSPMPSIEIDVDSTNDDNHRRIIEKSLVNYAEENQSVTASIYDYFAQSVNFGHHTNSIFFIVAKSQTLLKHIHASLKYEHSIKTRFGEYIPPSNGSLAYHIESGQAWRVDDMATLTLIEGCEKEEDLADVSEPDSVNSINKRPAARTYKARSDASVGSIKTVIENVFGLPEGSVALCSPDGSHLRSDAKIRTLRKRWSEK